jgi:DNA-binding transcriptional LysR family regulator
MYANDSKTAISMIDIRLKVFRSVAMNLSFTKASQELFISQPAISKHIQELEKEYNTRLFDRMGNRIQLTNAGQLLLEHAQKILKDYQKLDYDMNILQQKTIGELRIGASTTLSQYVLPEMIAGFKKQYPNIRITMLSGNSREIEAALTAGRIDIGMVEGFLHQPQLKYTAFMEDELVPIISTRGKLADKKTMTLDEFKTTPVVFREPGSGTLDVIQQALEKKGIHLSELNTEMNLGTTEGIKHYVEHSDCMGIVSIRSVSKEIYHDIFHIVDIEELQIDRKFTFVEKQGETTKLLKLFKVYITKSYRA